MDVAGEGVEEGVERRRGRRFIRWSFDRRLGENHTSSIMAKFRGHVNTAFYIRYSSAYVLVNNETRLRMVDSKQQMGSPWINGFAEAERWLND